MTPTKSARPSSAGGWIGLGLRWVGIFFFYAITMVAIGAATGAAVFSLLGPLFLDNSSRGEIAFYGLKTGAILAGIWAPGVAIVKCFVRGKKEREA